MDDFQKDGRLEGLQRFQRSPKSFQNHIIRISPQEVLKQVLDTINSPLTHTD